MSVSAQDSVKSSVIKQNFTSFTPLIRLKYPEFTIAAGYFLVKNANEGDPSSQHELGLRYLFGKGFELDTAKAVYWIKKAVDKKFPSACFNYGIMLLNEAGVKWDPFAAYRNFLIAAEKGMPEAQLIIGLFYLDNLIINRNLDKAVEWINKAVKLKYKPAEEVLSQIKENEGRFLDLSGIISKPQIEEKKKDAEEKDFAFEWSSNENDSLNQSIENVKEDEMLKKSYSDLKKFLNVKKNDILESRGDTTSTKLLQQGIKWGNPEAVLLSGLSSEKGTLNQKDLIAAASNYFRAYRLGINRAANMLLKLTTDQKFMELLNKSMERGDLEAIYVWSAITALNYNNKFTEEQSVEFLKKASERGHLQATVELGLCYYNGRGVKQDRGAAIELWNKAAAANCEDARTLIAFNNILNNDQNASLKNDYEYIVKAYENGSLLAQTALGYCYEKGIVVKQNKSEANKHYRNAVRRGSEIAMNSLRRLYDEMRPEGDEYKVYQE
jgi:TPR repeat protein